MAVCHKARRYHESRRRFSGIKELQDIGLAFKSEVVTEDVSRMCPEG